VLCSVSVLELSGMAQNQGNIYTVAGGGPANGVSPLSVAVASPWGVMADLNGNLYVSASERNQVYKIDTTGALSVVAGNGTAGFSGDRGAASDAQLSSPRGMAIDSSGDLFVADTFNHRIRRVDPQGVITTIAGTGTAGFSGDGGPAVSAQLNNPTSVTLDSFGNLLIADLANDRIRMVDTSGVITTVAGNGAEGFNGDGIPAVNAALNNPIGIALDTSGNLFIADLGNQRIRKIDTSGVITTVAGNGTRGYSGDGAPATAAQLSFPRGVAVDSSGNILIADTFNDVVREVDTSGIITTVAGGAPLPAPGTGVGDGGPATSAHLSNPTTVAMDSTGRMLIADQLDSRIRAVDSSATITTIAGNGEFSFSGDNGPATGAELSEPYGIAVDNTGDLLIADTPNGRVRKVDTSGIITTVAGGGTPAVGNGDGGPATDAKLGWFTGVAADNAGNLFIAENNPNVNACCSPQNRIRKVDSSGTITTVAGGGTPAVGNGDGGPATSASLARSTSVAVNGGGNLLITESFSNHIREVDALGIIATVAGNGTRGFSGDGGPAILAELNNPIGIAVDSAGNLFIADLGNGRVRKVDALGIITTIAGNGTFGFSGDGGPATNAQLNNPTGVAVDSAGNVFIADRGNNCIRMVDTLGIISTIAGNSTFGFSGDGGLAVNAQLSFPNGVAVDSAGDVFISDFSNFRIREVLRASGDPLGFPGPWHTENCDGAGASKGAHRHRRAPLDVLESYFNAQQLWKTTWCAVRRAVPQATPAPKARAWLFGMTRRRGCRLKASIRATRSVDRSKRFTFATVLTAHSLNACHPESSVRGRQPENRT